MKKVLFMAGITSLMFVAFACDDDKTNKFSVPSYHEGDTCTRADVFCDGNILVDCKRGTTTVTECKEDEVCLWFPDLAEYAKDDKYDPSPLAVCVEKEWLDDDYEPCDKLGKLNKCYPADHISVSTVVNAICLEANDGKKRRTYYDDDTFCDEGVTTCSEDGKSCGK